MYIFKLTLFYLYNIFTAIHHTIHHTHTHGDCHTLAVLNIDETFGAFSLTPESFLFQVIIDLKHGGSFQRSATFRLRREFCECS